MSPVFRKNNPRGLCGSWGGFTLIELLVVLAIIGLLVGLLLAALSKARTAAAIVVDGTSLKGVGTAICNYSADFSDYVPHRAPMDEVDNAGTYSSTNSCNIAGACAMGMRVGNSLLTYSLESREDGRYIHDFNVPMGLGQLVSRATFGNSGATTTYSTSAGYLNARDLFCKSDQQPFMPGQSPARNNWWAFADIAFTIHLQGWQAGAPDYNGLVWPTTTIVGGVAVANDRYYTSWAYRGADYAIANANDSLTGNNSLTNLRMSASVRHGKVMAMTRDPLTANFYNGGSAVGAHLLLNDGSVQFSENSYWRAGSFNSNVPGAVMPSGGAAVANPYTGEFSVASYKLTHAFAYADRYMLK
jgi:prepilin-type N-terminal cleavage/methylation domain-containing protein